MRHDYRPVQITLIPRIKIFTARISRELRKESRIVGQRDFIRDLIALDGLFY